MLKRMIGLTVVLGVTSGLAWANFPALRTKAAAVWNSQTGWSETDREADPAGFITYAEGKMQNDLDAMRETRRDLAAEIGDLCKLAREQSALASQAQALAEQFRVEYQEALANDSFPVAISNQAYTQSQAKSQVSLLLAEAEGYTESLAEIEKVQAEAEQKMEELAVRISKTESQMAALATKRELLRVRQLTTEGETLLAQVDEVMIDNTLVIADNPVRTVRELAEAERSKPAGRATESRVEQFLAEAPAAPPAVIEPVDDNAPEVAPAAFQSELPAEDVEESEDQPAPPAPLAAAPQVVEPESNDTVQVTPASYETAPPAKEAPKSKERPRSKKKPRHKKPIFQQS